MKDAYERRALLLHLGDVLEALSCLSRSGQRYATLGDAIAREDSLTSFTWLGYLDAAMTPQQVNERATAAFFLWPKTLLDEDLNRSLLASTVQHDLFAGNAKGWERYVAEHRKDVAWFAEGLQVRSDETKPESRFSRWPYPTETGS
ncbi:MAG TPA: hypothetical protein VKJ77_13470 [Caballeronia sp.]|jgi:hypothetical protein|nr:hypothetical protein [Caballeronia sp.]